MSLEIVDDDDELYRRLAPDFVRSDGRISSAAFKRGKIPDPEVSVDLARLTTPDETLRRANRLHHGIGMLVARIPRGLGLTARQTQWKEIRPTPSLRARPAANSHASSPSGHVS